jgi:hypothetical protein
MKYIIRRKGDGMPYRVRLDGGALWVHPACLREALDALKPPGVGVFSKTTPPEVTAWYNLREAVGLVEHIATHPAGTESIIAQVRQYRRRIKASDAPARPNDGCF